MRPRLIASSTGFPDAAGGGVTAGGGGGRWATVDPAGPRMRPPDRDRLVGPVGDGSRYVTWHRYRLEVVDTATGRAVAERDVTGDRPPYLTLDGPAVLLTDALLLIAGSRMPPGEHTERAEHVVLSTRTLRRLATVDYGQPVDAVRLIGSPVPGTWLTVDRAGTARVWSIDWPLVPVPGQMTLW